MHVVYNLLPASRAGALAAVVYSDRYFRYGLPLRASPPADARAPPHHAPPPPPRALLVPSAGLLNAAASPLPRASPRHTTPRRARRDLPGVFEPSARAAAYPPRYLPLLHRQPPGGASQPLPGASPLRRWRIESPRRSRDVDTAPRPEFALPDGCAAPCAPASSEEHAYSVPGPGAASGVSVLVRRKVLNTERYNNGARVVRRRAGGAQRAAVRVLLVGSGALYALAFLAFYFLSLP